MSTAWSVAVYSTVNATAFGRLLENDEAAPPVVVTEVHSHQPGDAFAQSGKLPAADADVSVVVATPESVLPSVAALLSGAQCDGATLAREVDAFAAGVAGLPARLRFVATWIAGPRFSGGLLALDERFGLDGILAAANLRLTRALRQHAATYPLNAGAWQRTLGERALNPKGWYLTKDPYAFELWKLAIADLKAGLLAASGRAKKLLLVDLDNTLWGGEVGDVGAAGLRLGGHDPAGEAYQAFQRELLALARRGVVLAIVSKNDEAVALQAIETHPEMVLRRDDFADWAIDWGEKAPKLLALCERLEISAADAVLIDDNPGERRVVSAAVPELTVPDWPANPLLYVDALRRMSHFDVPDVTAEDLGRTRSYAAVRARSERAEEGDAAPRIEVRPLVAADFPRALQLLNKTNQVNLATRRLAVDELRAWLAAGERGSWTVRVADAFADYGLVGVLSLEFEPPVCRVIDFVMSCRVLSRGVEERMLATARREARARGCEQLALQFLPTARNEPMHRFLAERSGLARVDDALFVSALADEPIPA